jgi:hypothetical protein
MDCSSMRRDVYLDFGDDLGPGACTAMGAPATDALRGLHAKLS